MTTFLEVLLCSIIFSIGLFGFLCALLSLFIIYRRSVLHNSFGYICGVHAVAEGGILFIFAFWAAPIMLIKPGMATGIVGVVFGQIINYFYYFACFIQLLKSANRFFATLFVIKYRVIFSVKSAKIIILIIGVLCLFCIAPFYAYDCNFLFDVHEVSWDVRNDTCEGLFTIVDLTTTSVTLVISFICDIVTFWYLRYRLTKQTTPNLARDIRFFAQTCITTALYAQIFIAFDILAPLAKTTTEFFLSKTLSWLLGHSLNVFSFCIFNWLLAPGSKMKTILVISDPQRNPKGNNTTSSSGNSPMFQLRSSRSKPVGGVRHS